MGSGLFYLNNGSIKCIILDKYEYFQHIKDVLLLSFQPSLCTLRYCGEVSSAL